MAWIVTVVVGWLLAWSAPPVAPAPVLRFHHLHYRSADPLAAMRRLTGQAAAQPSILQGLGVGVRIGQDPGPTDYVLFDRLAGLSSPSDPPAMMAAWPRLIAWLESRGFVVEADENRIRGLSERLSDDVFDHIAFTAGDFPDALNRLRDAGASLSGTTGEASVVEVSRLGTRFEIVRDPDQPDAFWCPMHPDVRSAAEGTCPICRMTLVPIPPPQAGEYRMDVQVLPPRRGPGASGLRLTLDTPSGERPTLLTVHDKRLHLFVIGEDLNYFQHVHPVARSDGRFEWTNDLPAGAYMVVGDFTPAGGTPQMVQRAIVTRGYDWTPIAAKTAAALGPSSSIVVSGIRAELASPALATGQTAIVRVSLTDEHTEKPVADLEPYLSAPAHGVLASADLTSVAHVHPQEQDAFGPTLSFEILPVAAGPYKLWVQIQRRGHVLTFPFVLRVEK
ncbi:MAG TPA: heavy metal-binding domain-containing protein [Vicinamibacterales bacterium]|nr:heavy metal-binding domain-containing protein [Vicinamibacterales bacterium]